MSDGTEQELQTITADDVGALPPPPSDEVEPLTIGAVSVPVELDDGTLEELRGMLQGAIWRLFERLQGDIAREVRVMLGEEAYDQRIFTDEERTRRVAAMQRCAALQTSDVERHQSWMEMHLEQGWVYGEQFSPTAKTHPNLLSWDELPASTRSKARIFDICARYAAVVSGMIAGG